MTGLEPLLLATLIGLSWLAVSPDRVAAPTRAALAAGVRSGAGQALVSGRDRWRAYAPARRDRVAARRKRREDTRRGRAMNAVGKATGTVAATIGGIGGEAVSAGWTAARVRYAAARDEHRQRRENGEHTRLGAAARRTVRRIRPAHGEHDDEHAPAPGTPADEAPTCREGGHQLGSETACPECAAYRRLSPADQQLVTGRPAAPAPPPRVTAAVRAAAERAAAAADLGDRLASGTTETTPATGEGSTNPTDTGGTSVTANAPALDIPDINALLDAAKTIEQLTEPMAKAAEHAEFTRGLPDALTFGPGREVVPLIQGLAESTPDPAQLRAWAEAAAQLRPALQRVVDQMGVIGDTGVSGHTDQLAPA